MESSDPGEYSDYAQQPSEVSVELDNTERFFNDFSAKEFEYEDHEGCFASDTIDSITGGHRIPVITSNNAEQLPSSSARNSVGISTDNFNANYHNEDYLCESMNSSADHPSIYNGSLKKIYTMNGEVRSPLLYTPLLSSNHQIDSGKHAALKLCSNVYSPLSGTVDLADCHGAQPIERSYEMGVFSVKFLCHLGYHIQQLKPSTTPIETVSSPVEVKNVAEPSQNSPETTKISVTVGSSQVASFRVHNSPGVQMKRTVWLRIKAPSAPEGQKEIPGNPRACYFKELDRTNMMSTCSHSTYIKQLNSSTSADHTAPPPLTSMDRKKERPQEAKTKQYSSDSSIAASGEYVYDVRSYEARRSPMKEEEPEIYAYELEQFRRAFQHDHCYLHLVKEKPQEAAILNEFTVFAVQKDPLSPISDDSGCVSNISPHESRDTPIKEEPPEPSTKSDEHKHFLNLVKHDHCYDNKGKEEREQFTDLPLLEAAGSSELFVPPETSMPGISYELMNYPQIRMKYSRDKWKGDTGVSDVKKKYSYQSVRCNLCNSPIMVKGRDWHAKSCHAIIHTNIERYHCPICELYGSRHRAEVVRHVERVHERTTFGISIKEDMSPDDILALRNMVALCFGTRMNRKGRLQTQLMNFYEEHLEEANK